MNDFLQGYYGPAAPYVRQYIDSMHNVMQRSSESLDIYGYPTRSANGYLSAEMLASYGRIFDQAESAASSDPDGSISSYSWNFGDGSSGSGVSTTHTYTAGGNYALTLTVTVTVAPGTTAPDWSVTCPVMLPPVCLSVVMPITSF